MRWTTRLVLATLAFVLALVAVYNLYVSTQPVHHDLSDVSTGLVGLCLGGFAGVIGAAVALVLTRNRPH